MSKVSNTFNTLNLISSAVASGVVTGTSVVTSSVTNAALATSNYLYASDSFELLGQDKEILKIGNILNSIFVNRSEIDIPRLVVVGSQSSGKSSILNSILGMDILPTGSNMVTRCPLQLELIQSKTETRATFGEYVDGIWNTIKDVDIKYPDPTNEQRKVILQTITDITNNNAGNSMNITNIPINLRISCPNVPNLSLTDMPGLTMVPMTDKGQPVDIKERIRELIGEYIQPKSTIILAIMPARTDVEADIALELIKEYDPNGERTLGILTKLDLMNIGTDITHLLDDKVSKDLQLGYGYFGIRNRNKVESETKSVMDGLRLEQEYFKSHSIYSNQKYKDKLGVPSLCKSLSGILVKSLKRCFPLILDKISSDLESNNQKLIKLGSPIPKEDTQQSVYIHKILAKLTRNFITILDDRGKIISTGRNIKQNFVEYRNNLLQLDPFNEKDCKDAYIKQVIANCEGNHMSFPSPPVEVLEQIIKDPQSKPLQVLNMPSKKCAQQIMNELTELLDLIVKDLGIDRFPNFNKLVITTCMNDVFMPALQNTYSHIDDELNSQENYIWTDNPKFQEILHNPKKSTLEVMRELCRTYFASIVYIMQDVIPKKIMYTLVHKSQKQISTKLYEKIKDSNFSNLLVEYDEIHFQRMALEQAIKELNSAKGLIETVI